MPKSFLHIIVTLALFVGCYASGLGQSTPGLPELGWVKQEQIVKPGDFFFNVIRIENTGSSAISVQLELKLPAGARLTTAIPGTIDLPANSVKSIPVRFMPSKKAAVDTSYTVEASLKSGSLQRSASTRFGLEAQRGFQVKFESKTYGFEPEQETLTIPFSILNNGNITEKASFSIQVSEEIGLVGPSDFEIAIDPYSELTRELQFRPKTWYRKNGFNNATVAIRVNNNGQISTEQLYLSKFENEYDNQSGLSINEYNKIEYDLRVNEDGRVQNNFSTTGQVNTDKGELVYGARVSDFQEKIDSSFFYNNEFELYYQTRNRSFGIGTSNPYGLTGLMKRNSFFVDQSVGLGQHNQLNLTANKLINEKDYGFAAGHELLFRGLASATSAGYNLNQTDDVNTFQINNYTQFQQRWLSGTYHLDFQNDQSSDTDKNQNIFLQDIDLNSILLDQRLELHLSSRIANTTQPETSSFSSGTWFNLSYKPTGKSSVLGFIYSNNSQDAETQNGNSSFNSNFYRAQFSSPLARRVQLYNGLQYKGFRQLGSDSVWTKGNNYAAFSSLQFTAHKFSSQTTAQLGMKTIGNEQTGLYDFRAAAAYNQDGRSSLSMDVQYSNARTNLYTNANNPQLEVHLGLEQSLPGKNNHFTLNAYYRKESTAVSSPLSLKAGLDLWTKNNFNINTSVDFKTRSSDRQFGLSTIEARVSKYFNWKDGKNSLYNLDLLFFKDENGNNIPDPGEERIAGIRTVLSPEQAQTTHNTMQLVSGSSGNIKYKNLPTGNYLVKFYPMTDLNGYYNFGESEFSTELVQDETIPVAFAKAGRITGTIVLSRSQFSALGEIDISNIRVTATDANGKSYSALTDKFGNYAIYLPKNRTYTVSIHNIFGAGFQIKQESVQIDLTQTQDPKFDFEIMEKKRNINFGK